MAIADDRKAIQDLGDALIIKVPYSADLGFPLFEALRLAKEVLPREKKIIRGLRNVKTSEDLERLLKEANITLIVEKNFAEDFLGALDNEEAVAAESEEDLDTVFCPIDPPEFTSEELDALLEEICDIPEEPEDLGAGINPDDLTEELSSDEPAAEKAELEKCLQDIDAITQRITDLTKEEEKIREVQFELEEAEWFYIIATEYYKERNIVVKKYLGIFQPLLEEQRRLEEELLVAPEILSTFGEDLGLGKQYTRVDTRYQKK